MIVLPHFKTFSQYPKSCGLAAEPFSIFLPFLAVHWTYSTVSFRKYPLFGRKNIHWAKQPYFHLGWSNIARVEESDKTIPSSISEWQNFIVICNIWKKKYQTYSAKDKLQMNQTLLLKWIRKYQSLTGWDKQT